MSKQSDNALVADRVRAARLPGMRGKKKKKKRPSFPLRDVPNDCSVLAIDGASTTGWSMHDRGNLRAYGECDVFGDEPKEIIARFLALPGPHVIVVERVFGIRFGTQASLAVGETIWRQLAKRTGFGKRIVRVYVGTWRSKVIGKRPGHKRDDWQREERAKAETYARHHLGAFAMREFVLGPESAPAILIGKWGAFCEEVFAVLPKPRAKKASAA